MPPNTENQSSSGGGKGGMKSTLSFATLMHAAFDEDDEAGTSSTGNGGFISDGNGGFIDDDPGFSKMVRNGFRHGENVAQIRRTVFVRWCAHGNKMHITTDNAFLRIGGKV